MDEQNEGRLIARVTIEVDVHLEREPGRDTPFAYELPYEYLVVRAAEAVKLETFGATGPLALASMGGMDDCDPDSLIESEILAGLSIEQEARNG